ncbi:MAG: hypothetical protein IJ365_02490, partial [Clostridia bacterium]|nr:hypothetical protein [Clostridia bacterium]
GGTRKRDGRVVLQNTELISVYSRGRLWVICLKSVIYKCRKIAEDFPTTLFLLILPPKKHSFLEKLISIRG